MPDGRRDRGRLAASPRVAAESSSIRAENSGSHEARSDEPLRFELLVVHDDAAAITERIAQRRDERRARIARVGRQEFEMLGRCARLPLHMHAPLERNLIVGTHPCKAWQGRIHGFKISEVERILQPANSFSEFRAVPRLSHLHAGTRTTEPSCERVVLGDVVNGLDAESDKLCDRAGMNSGKTQNVIFRNRGIAMIKKLASEWIAAVPSSRNVGSLRHCEDTKF